MASSSARGSWRQSPVQANRTQALISSIYSFGIEHEDLLGEILEFNPCAGLKKLGEERPADRALSWAEIRALWTAWAAAGTVGALAHQFGLLTGQRKGEFLRATVGEVEWLDLGAWWELPGERTKIAGPTGSSWARRPARSCG